MDKITFTINGEKYTLSGSSINPDTSLNEYIRYYLNLKGTKGMCYEGGCGACAVSVSAVHPRTKERRVFSVNSCLVHILSCHQWDITTVEGVGNRRDGYDAVQTRLAAFNGTQCGYCSPGWVTSMYSLVKSSKHLTLVDVEKSFGGNMCRCTGYRPILDAFKSFAVDVGPELKGRLQDLEDLDQLRCAKDSTKKCTQSCRENEDDWCFVEKELPASLMSLGLNDTDSRWYKAFAIDDIFTILSREKTKNYKLIAGNTGQGVFWSPIEPKVLIDITSVEDLHHCTTSMNLCVGAALNLTDLMDLCTEKIKDSDFKYLEQFREHLDLVAHVPVRNIGTIGGNLALKNQHHEFPSDIFVLLATVGATITIMNSSKQTSDVFLKDFLKLDLNGKLITSVKLPPLSSSCHIRTYKIMTRAQNAHAIVNAGFLFKLSSNNTINKCTIVYGNISPKFIQATATESAITSRDLFSDNTLQLALNSLKQEVNPVENPPEPAAASRKILTLGLFYKAILSLSPSVSSRYKSGGELLKRGISRGTQSFDTDQKLWPLNKPTPKLEALSQCSGEADYICDVDTISKEVQVSFVLSTVAVADIEEIDASEALAIPGVLAFYSAKDIPGKNTFTPKNVPWITDEEEILATKKVTYFGQPIGLIAAVTKKLSMKAARLVKVTYKNIKKPLVSINDVLASSEKEKRVRLDANLEAKSKGTDVKHIIRGTSNVPSQYHYTMETQCCAVKNTPYGVSVRSSTQWMDLVHVAVAASLNLPEKDVEVSVSRVGGGYGGKASRSALVACACALVARKLNRPATLMMSIYDNMTVIGKRMACQAEYEVGVDDEGVIQYVDLKYYSNVGCSYNDAAAEATLGVFYKPYNISTWSIKGYSVLTDTASNTWCRAPGTTEAIAIMEDIMEKISYTLNKDPIAIRMKNVSPQQSGIIDMITSFKSDNKYDDRQEEIRLYNSQNAWKKKALKLSIMCFPIEYSGNFPVTISVYHGDGTIAISHGGIEMGQGINTKIAQVCAYCLKVPLESVSVRGSDNFVSPNSMASNGSITSECVAYAVTQACKQLTDRLNTVDTDPSKTWTELVSLAYNKGLDLQASYMYSENDKIQPYSVLGVCAAEVELDVLTGGHVVTRVDILEDTGVSMSPDIDVGQIEGAFIMGMGLWTSEELIYSEAGRLLNASTWTYKPPGARDVPVDFRVAFKRNSVNPAGVLRSKATGEPALTLAVVLTYALHSTIIEARKEFGYNDAGEWLQVDTPYTVANILKAIAPKTEYFKIKEK